jgi:tetratricopeptide (TPR) repeat protein
MADLMRRAGEYNKAIDYIDNCIEIVGAEDERTSDFMMDKAFVLTLAYQRSSDKDYLERAIKQYESLLVKWPNNTTVLNNLAYMLASNDQKLPEALEYTKRAHEAIPNSAGIMDTYGFVLYKNGRYGEADSFLQAALQHYEQSSISVPAELYEHVGMVKEALKLRQEAIDAYEQALKEGESELSGPAQERIRAAIRRLSAEGP